MPRDSAPLWTPPQNQQREHPKGLSKDPLEVISTLREDTQLWPLVGAKPTAATSEWDHGTSDSVAAHPQPASTAQDHIGHLACRLQWAGQESPHPREVTEGRPGGGH